VEAEVTDQVFFKLKTLLRKASERTLEAPSRIGDLIGHFTPAECAITVAAAVAVSRSSAKSR
jgi:hypothetical protein